MGLPGWAGWSCCFLQASWLFKPKVAVQACCLCKHAVWKAHSRLASGTWSSWSGLRVSWQKQSHRQWRVCIFSSCYKVVSPVEWINNHVRSETPHFCCGSSTSKWLMEIVRAMSQNGKVMVTGEHTTMPVMGLGPNPGWDFFVDLPAIVQFSQVME